MIARPARVRMRSRKPCVLDRRRLFGWNVRLLTRNSYDRTCGGARPPAGGRARGAGGPRSWSPWRCGRRATRRCTVAAMPDPATDRPSIAETGDLPATAREATGQRAALRVPAVRGTPRPRAPGTPQQRLPIVARLWTGLLASPSLRIGRRGPGAGSTRRVGNCGDPRPGARNGASTSDDTPVRPVLDRGRGGAVDGRAHPVDTGVELLRTDRPQRRSPGRAPGRRAVGGAARRPGGPAAWEGTPA
jgi:hypothetical protein